MAIYWDPNPDCFVLPFLGWPIKWYGVLFAAGFALALLVARGILSRTSPLSRDQVVRSIDRLSLYIVIGTVVGARLGHFLFYEEPSLYLHNPLELFWIRQGGLASHGGAAGILLALWLFSRKKILHLSFIGLLDLLAVPTALVATFIRIGNFINQEILGTFCSLPWAVRFGHPQDGSLPIPRHPVQLYEAIVYFMLFLLLWRLTFRPQPKGRLIGLFLIGCFSSRILIDFFKEEQSNLLNSSALLGMGQWLSIPFIALGGFLIWFSFKRPKPIMKKEF